MILVCCFNSKKASDVNKAVVENIKNLSTTASTAKFFENCLNTIKADKNVVKKIIKALLSLPLFSYDIFMSETKHQGIQCNRESLNKFVHKRLLLNSNAVTYRKHIEENNKYMAMTIITFIISILQNMLSHTKLLQKHHIQLETSENSSSVYLEKEMLLVYKSLYIILVSLLNNDDNCIAPIFGNNFIKVIDYYEQGKVLRRATFVRKNTIHLDPII